ncbi:MAG: restriction endonuclease subunit S [Victivallales bacterium]
MYKLCSVVRGGSPRPIEKFLGGTIPWIKIGDATQGNEVYLDKTKEHIIEAGLSKTRYIHAGSLIFANCGVSLGFARIIRFNGCIHDGWLAFDNISSRLNKVFFLKSLNHCTDYFRQTAPDGTQPNLNTTIMKYFMQILPPIELQEQFASFVEQLDKSKVTIRKSLEKLNLTYRALLQEYFG